MLCSIKSISPEPSYWAAGEQQGPGHWEQQPQVQGVQLQQVSVPRNLSIPTGPDSAPVHLRAGDKVMVIRTVKGEKKEGLCGV